MSIAERLAEVRGRIDAAARAAGRDAASVKLIAVSKTKPPEAILEAYAAGQRAFGENYAQELAAKAEALKDIPDIEWHFIGHLQSNKVKVVARAAHVIHTVDSAGLARELGKRTADRAASDGRESVGRDSDKRFPVLIEVNVAGEPQKPGASPGDIAEVASAVTTQPSLVLRGLMTMPPAGDLRAAKRAFDTLVSLRNLHGGTGALPELSMGMSADLEAAVGCGATYVRVGSAIFGAR